MTGIHEFPTEESTLEGIYKKKRDREDETDRKILCKNSLAFEQPVSNPNLDNQLDIKPNIESSLENLNNIKETLENESVETYPICTNLIQENEYTNLKTLQQEYEDEINQFQEIIASSPPTQESFEISESTRKLMKKMFETNNKHKENKQMESKVKFESSLCEKDFNKNFQ
jgi:hypothetical protein